MFLVDIKHKMKTIKIIKGKDINHKTAYALYFRKTKNGKEPNGFVIYTYPWSPDKYMYVFLSYLKYMYNPKVTYVISADCLQDVFLITYLRNAILYYNGKMFKTFDEVRKYFLNKKHNRSILKAVMTLPNYKTTIFWDGLNSGLFPCHEDDEMIDYWGSERVGKDAIEFMKYIGEY